MVTHERTQTANHERDREWLTLQQAAQRAQVHEATLRRAASRGTLRIARVGGARLIRIRPMWVDEWLTANATPVESAR